MPSPIFQKRHYEVCAKLLAKRLGNDNYDKADIIADFADAFASDNANFDRERFLRAVYR